MLPAGELSGQWLYLAKVAMGAAVGWVVLAFLYYRKGYDMGARFLSGQLFGVLLFWLLLRLFMA